MGPDHSPLSKRHGATSVAEFRARGYLPEALVNYLALIGWSPRGRSAGTGESSELMAPDELARRFSLRDVGHSAGVFDEEKLAWVNRHYLKVADPVRLAGLSVPYFQDARVSMAPDRDGVAFLASVMPMVSASVDRLNQVPQRLAFLFEFSPEQAVQDDTIRQEATTDESRQVIAALAEELRQAPRLDRDRFRELANRVRARTGQKGKALFHPIRIALTGRSDGPELDLAVPAIDRGAELPESSGIPRIVGNRERAARFDMLLRNLAKTSPTTAQ
jgi:glutamyl-tRNA synthetase/nondiscriminating glutamyl-tRNA synthetase